MKILNLKKNTPVKNTVDISEKNSVDNLNSLKTIKGIEKIEKNIDNN